MAGRAETGERRREGEGARGELPVGSRRPTKRVRKPFYRIKVDGGGRGRPRRRRPAGKVEIIKISNFQTG